MGDMNQDQFSKPPMNLSDLNAVSMYLKDKIRVFHDFPITGKHFIDITTLLQDPIAFQFAIDVLAHRYKDQNITHIASCEARGFLFGAPLALALKIPFVPVRRARRLPGATVGEDYTTGFYTGRLEIHEDSIPHGSRVIIIDDSVASGNTLKVIRSIINRLGGEVIECGCIIKSLHSDFDIPLFGLVDM